MTYIGSRLRYLRKQDRITQQQLADSIGVAKSTISMYENGQREPDFETLESLADYFNVDMSTFFPGGSTIRSTFPLPSADDKKGERIAVPGETLSPEEAEIIRLLRQVPDDQREMALRMINAALDSAEAHRQQSPMPPAGPDKI